MFKKLMLIVLTGSFVSVFAMPVMSQNTGACCERGYCSVATQEQCESWEGVYMGDGTVCSEGICESIPGACCYGDGECAYVSESECEGYNGEFKGEGTDCTDDPEDDDDIAEVCEEPVYGACCTEQPGTDNIVCIEVTEDECVIQDGTYLGDNTYCINIDGNENDISDICEDAPGACCLDDGSCSVMNAIDCQLAGGEFRGADTDCYDDPEDEDDIAEVCEDIEQTGACCEYMGSWYCSVTTQELCESWDAIYAGDGTECYDGLCEELSTGACCYEEFEETYCVAIDEDNCINYYNGEWMGAGTDCTDGDENGVADACEEPSTGACCIDGGMDCYSDMTETDCDMNGGTWMSEGTDCTDSDENGIADVCEETNTYEYLPGDANMSAGAWPPMTIGGDVTYLVSYFRGITPACMIDGFYASADANGSCSVTGADVTKLVSYFRGMDDLSFCQDYPTTWPPLPDTAPDGWPNCASPILSK